MQCFWAGYRGICHVSLVFSVYTQAFRWVCIRRKYKWHVACSTVSHEKALHNYFIPCLNLRRTYGNFRKSSEISSNFRKLRKCFTTVLEELKRFKKILENVFGKIRKWFKIVLKSSEILGKLRKRSQSVFQMFLWFLEIFGKSSEVFGKYRKISGHDRKCS